MTDGITGLSEYSQRMVVPPDEVIAISEVHAEIARQLAPDGTLSRRGRALVMRYWYDMTLREIGDAICVTSAHMRMILALAIRTMRSPPVASRLVRVSRGAVTIHSGQNATVRGEIPQSVDRKPNT